MMSWFLLSLLSSCGSNGPNTPFLLSSACSAIVLGSLFPAPNANKFQAHSCQPGAVPMSPSSSQVPDLLLADVLHYRCYLKATVDTSPGFTNPLGPCLRYGSHYTPLEPALQQLFLTAGFIPPAHAPLIRHLSTFLRVRTFLICPPGLGTHCCSPGDGGALLHSPHSS